MTNAEITAPKADQSTPAAIEPPSPLIRGVGLAGATTLNMIDMIGVGPFITIPLIIAAMGDLSSTSCAHGLAANGRFAAVQQRL